MSYYRGDEYIFDFAERTKKNLVFIEKYVDEQKSKGVPVEDIQVFEVTQLINSFMGLLVLPKESDIAFLDDDISKYLSEETQSIFSGLVRNHNLELFCYEKKYKGRKIKRKLLLTPRLLIYCLRNSICHDEARVEPQRPTKGNEIEKWCFKSGGKPINAKVERSSTMGNLWNIQITKNKYDPLWILDFSITLSIHEIKELLFVTSDLLLAQKIAVKGGRH